MPLKKAIISSGISLFCISALSAQDLTKHRPLQQVVGFQEYVQRKWRMQKLPNNSFFLRSNLDYTYPAIEVPETYSFFGPNWCGTGRVSSDDAEFKADFYTKKMRYFQWHTESWWRDNSEETISSFLKNVLLNIDLTPQ